MNVFIKRFWPVLFVALFVAVMVSVNSDGKNLVGQQGGPLEEDVFCVRRILVNVVVL